MISFEILLISLFDWNMVNFSSLQTQTNIQLQKAPSNDVQHLQEELIAVKLREAEANLSLKEMKHKVYDLESQWEVTHTISI